MGFPQSFSRRMTTAPATWCLLAMIGGVYLVTAIQSHSFGTNLADSSLGARWTLYLPAMGDTWFGPLRAIGSFFLHQGPAHLLMNGIMLWLFGEELERTVGTWLFAAMVLGGGVGAAAISIWADPNAAAVGASGGLYALMAIALGLSVRIQINTRPLLVLIAVNLGYTLIIPGISLWGHLGGLIAGSVIAIPLALGATHRQTMLATGICWAAAIIAIVIRVIFYTHGVWSGLVGM